MGFYVIQRIDQGGGYVASIPDPHTYTRDLAKAKRFSTRKAAEIYGSCENERVVFIGA